MTYPYQNQAEPMKPKPSYTRRDLVFSLVFFVAGLTFSLAMPFRASPLAVFLSLVVLFVLTALCYGKGAIAAKRRSVIMIVLYAVFLLPFLTNANATLRFFTFLFLLLLLAFYWYDKTVLCHAPLLDGDLISQLYKAISAYFLRYSAAFGAIASAIGRGEKSKKGARTIGYIFLGLGLAILPTVMIGALLSYDASFTALLDNIFDFSFEKVFARIWDIIVAILLGSAFYSLMRTSLHREELPEKKKIEFHHSAIQRPILYAAVTPILILYALFFISQKDYYLSAFTKTLPEGLTFAEYAREGFFELCTVACINALLLLVFSLLMKKKEGSREILRRVYQGVIAFFTLILIATAFSKMFLYIDTYGLTHKRVYASWLMAVLALLFVAILVKQFFKKLPFVKVALVITVLMLALITLPNIDGVIADYNVEGYLDKTLDTVDIEELESLGISSVEARVRLEREWMAREDTLTEDERAALGRLSTGLDREWKQLDARFFAFSIPQARARRLLEERADRGRDRGDVYGDFVYLPIQKSARKDRVRALWGHISKQSGIW